MIQLKSRVKESKEEDDEGANRELPNNASSLPDIPFLEFTSYHVLDITADNQNAMFLDTRTQISLSHATDGGLSHT